MKHWTELSATEKVDEIAAVHAVGMTCAEIAAAIGVEGVSANAIIGMYSHYPQLRQRFPLRKREGVKTGPRRDITADDDFPGAKRLLLTELGSRACRWPLEGVGAQTLFCGCDRPLAQSYCARHQTMAKGRSVM